MKTPKEWLEALYEVDNLTEHDIAEIQKDAIASTQKAAVKLIEGCLSPVTDNPQEDAFYKKVDP